MPNGIEISGLVISFLGGGIVSSWLTHRLTIRSIQRDQTRDADISTYNQVKGFLDEDAMSLLKEAEYYTGVEQERHKQLNRLLSLLESADGFCFHDAELQSKLVKLHGSLVNMLMLVAKYTTPEHGFVTTKTSRNDDQETRERELQESEQIFEMQKIAYDDAFNFLKLAKIKLRI
ncbi:hypothetical protein ACUN9V_09555 [Salinicola sp. V024]|uniref:hypothetical protein n=1 Tax=Salinicola sp. V024 TaxID=3459609 RepID=UPI004043A41A